MSLVKKQIADALGKTAKGQKLGVSRFEKTIKKEFKDAVDKVMQETADEYSVRVKASGFRRTGDMLRNSRIFGHEFHSETHDRISCLYGLNVGDEANMHWKLGGWKWNFFEFKSPNNENIPILDVVLDGLSDRIKAQFKKEIA
ncbi:MAG TPA: hypothetical protein DF712_20775 [Balneola sp.]|nr:hypothetical protein [Balneola sp.]